MTPATAPPTDSDGEIVGRTAVVCSLCHKLACFCVQNFSSLSASAYWRTLPPAPPPSQSPSPIPKDHQLPTPRDKAKRRYDRRNKKKSRHASSAGQPCFFATSPLPCIQYLYPTAVTTATSAKAIACVVPSFGSPAFCDKIISLSRAAGFCRELPGSSYSQATVDLEVDKAPALRDFLRNTDMVATIALAMTATHGVRPMGFDDMFVVRYAADEQRELVRHVDGGDVSFMLALSLQSSYDGGGTRFDDISETVHLQQGDLIVFDAHQYHAGVAVTKGERFLLVGFCYTTRPAGPGSLDLSLALIAPPPHTIHMREEKNVKERKKKRKGGNRGRGPMQRKRLK